MLVACLLAPLSLGCGNAEEPESSAATPGEYVEIVTIEPILLEHQVALTGQFEAEFAVVIRPELDGVVASLEFEEGARVAEGDLLVGLRNAEQKAHLALARAELKLAKTVFDRTERLSKRDISAVSQVEEATAKLDEARARVALAQVDLERTLIRAPFDGVVGMRQVNVGERVEEGDPLVSLDAVDRLQLIFTVQSTGFSLGKPGDVIHARVFSYPGERFPGEVFFVSPTIDPATRRMILKAWVANAEQRLKPGMFANVDVQVARREGALVVPETAVVYDRHGTYVWKATEDRRALKVPVRVGLRQPGRVEITEGVAAGDLIVSVGTHKIAAGDRLIDVDSAGEVHAGTPETEDAAPKERREES